MKKFEFVNQNYERLDGGVKPKQFTYSDNRDQKKKPFWQKYWLPAIVLLIVIGTVFYFVNKENPRELTQTAGSGTVIGSRDGKKSGDGQSSDGKLPVAGLSADFEPEVLNEGAKAVYKLDLQRKKDNQFTATAEIDVTNTSERSWNNISFYFFPNQFGDLAKEQCRRKVVSFAVDKCLQELGQAETTIEKVALNGEELAYNIEGVQVTLPLKQALKTGQTGKVSINYSFSLPGTLIENGGYNLLQWHPLLPGYEKDWLLHPLAIGKDTYSVSPSDMTLSYKLPKSMQVVTSAVDGENQSSSGVIPGEKLKEMFVLLLGGHQMVNVKTEETEIRIFSSAKDQNRAAETLKTAKEAVAFFEKRLGESPNKQLDIVLTEARKGSYPGIILQPGKIEVDRMAYIETNESLEHLLVHQIAQQWFYGNVHFERHTDIWMNDGLSELATSLFFLAGQKKSEEKSFDFSKKHNDWIIMREDVKANLPADQYAGSFGGIVGHIQAKPAIYLWELLKPYGEEKALTFLSDYLKTYSGKKVATIEFIRFTKDYLKLTNNAFEGWLDFNPYSDYDMSDFYNL